MPSTAAARPLLAVVDLTCVGLLRYGASLQVQEHLAQLRRADTLPNTLLLVQVRQQEAGHLQAHFISLQTGMRT